MPQNGDGDGGVEQPRRRRQPVPKWFRDAAAMRQAARATYGKGIYGPGHFWPPASQWGGPEFTPPYLRRRRRHPK